MWYEILPIGVILVSGITFTPVFGYYLYKFMQNGNPYRRDIRTNPFDKGLLQRDLYLFKKPYVIQGLNNIPDEENSDDKSSDGKSSDGKSSNGEKDPCKC